MSNPELLAIEAKQVLEAPAFRRAVSGLQDEYFRQFCDTEPNETEEREAIYFRMKALEDLERDLNSAMIGARVAVFNNRLRQNSK